MDRARTHVSDERNFAVGNTEVPPRALQTSECNELLDPTRKSCLILFQRQPGKLTDGISGVPGEAHAPLVAWVPPPNVFSYFFLLGTQSKSLLNQSIDSPTTARSRRRVGLRLRGRFSHHHRTLESLSKLIRMKLGNNFRSDPVRVQSTRSGCGPTRETL